MRSVLSSADLLALKTATLDLVKAVGGLQRAADLRGVSTTTVHRWYAERRDDDPDRESLVTIDALAIAVLERDLAERGDPRRPVTACLARLNGCAVTDGPADAERASVAASAARLIKAEAALSADLVEAIADKALTPTDAAIADRLAADVDTAVADLRGALAEARIVKPG